jgi:hypothetical protein
MFRSKQVEDLHQAQQNPGSRRWSDVPVLVVASQIAFAFDSHPWRVEVFFFFECGVYYRTLAQFLPRNIESMQSML